MTLQQKRDWLMWCAKWIWVIWAGMLIFGLVSFAVCINYSYQQDQIWNKAIGNPQLECLTLFNDHNERLFEHFINGMTACGSKSDSIHNHVPLYEYRDDSGNIVIHLNENVNQQTGVWH